MKFEKFPVRMNGKKIAEKAEYLIYIYLSIKDRNEKNTSRHVLKMLNILIFEWFQ